MSQYPARPERPSRIWISYLSITFGASLVLLGSGIVALPLASTLRVWLLMGLIIMVGSSFMFAGTVLRPARRHRAPEPPLSARYLHR